MYLLGIDLGTSSAKSAIFSTDGRMIGIGEKEYVFESVRPGYAEQAPDVWWDAVKESVRKALEAAEIKKEEIKAIGLSGQMHGMVALDAEGNVIRKAILHCDVRASEEVDEIRQLLGSGYEKITYNPIFPGFQGVSLFWLRKHEPQNYKRIYKVICPKDYIRYRMTGKIGTEHTDASGTLLYDMEKSQWSEDIFNKLGLDRNIVPEKIADSCDVAGELTEKAASELGLMKGTIVAYGGGDQAMQSVGNGVYAPGIMTVTIGTSGQVLKISDHPVFNPKLNTHTFRHVEDNKWFGLGAVLFAGSTFSWFKREFLREFTYKELDDMSNGVPPGCNGLVFFPCMGGERTPYLDAETRGLISGMTMMHNKASYVRAIMEGVTFAMEDSVNLIESLYGMPEKIICAGGGVKGGVWAQIQADIYGADIYISRIKEQACLGAAVIAGVAIGKFGNLEDACTAMCDKEMRVIHPDKKNYEFYQRLYHRVYQKIYKRNKEIFHIMKEFA